MRQPHEINRLEYYKRYSTAWSPVYEQFVELERIYLDDQGDVIIKGRLENEKYAIVFRPTELANYLI